MPCPAAYERSISMRMPAKAAPSGCSAGKAGQLAPPPLARFSSMATKAVGLCCSCPGKARWRSSRIQRCSVFGLICWLMATPATKASAYWHAWITCALRCKTAAPGAAVSSLATSCPRSPSRIRCLITLLDSIWVYRAHTTLPTYHGTIGARLCPAA